MDHLEAVRTKAAEKYMLGELSGKERDDYEDHFFGCQECASEVKLGAILVDSAKEVLSSPHILPEKPAREIGARRPWFAWFMRPQFVVPALASLLLIIAYQNAVLIPRMKTATSDLNAAGVLPSFSLITSNSRGGAPLTIRVSRNQLFGLYLDIPPEKKLSSYTCTVENTSGSVEFSASVSATQAREAVQLLLSSSRLSPGNHILIVRGSGASDQASGAPAVEVARYEFNLQFIQ